MGIYDDEIDSAYELISESGGAITIEQPSGAGIYNPVTRTFASTGGSTFGTCAIKIDYKEKFIDGSVIKRGDCKFLVPAKNADFPPESGHYLIQSASTWNIVNAESIDPSGVQPIMWEVQARR